MLPAAQTYQVGANGDSGAPLFQDVGTRVLQTVRLGENAGKLGAGPQNVFAGYEAGREARSVTQTVCIGYQAGAATYGTAGAVFIGAFAGAANQGGNESVFVGFSAGQTNRYGDTLTAVGAYAMRENYSGSRSTAVGYRAMERNLNGDDNTAVGAEAFQGLRSGSRNTATGFRAGRGAQGDENVFTGAYAGYSNNLGNGNCLVGYRSGEFLTDGNYNVGIGPYTLQNAAFASCNVAIGPFAGANVGNSVGTVTIGAFAGASNTNASSNVIIGSGAAESATGNECVIIGAEAARFAAANRLVVIGAQAAHDIRAEGSVIIGYGAADNLIWGGYNVMIGPGANTYTTSNTNGICIGTQNVFASDYTVSIGEEIQNKRSRSILVGFSLQSDANNSVILGNEITLQSVLFFKDPISQDFAEAVRADALSKFGISDIAYGTSNQLLATPDGSATFLYGTAGLLTSNTFSTATTLVDAGVSPADYDLRAYIASQPTASAATSNYVLLRPRAFAVRSNADFATVASFSASALSNIYSETNAPAAAAPLVYGQPPAVTPAGAALASPSPVNGTTSNLTLGDALYVNDLRFSTTNFPTPGDTIVNFYAPAAAAASLDFPVAKRARTPYFSTATSNLEETLRSRLSAASVVVLSPGLSFSNEIAFSPSDTGVHLLDPANLAAYASPAQRAALALSNAFAYAPGAGSAAAYGAVSAASGSLTYTPYPEAAYAASDAFSIEPVLQVQGYGVPPAPNAPGTAGGRLTFAVTAATDFAASNLLVANRITIPAESNAFPFGTSHLLAVPGLGATTPLRFTEISSNLLLVVAPSASPLTSPYAPSGLYASNALSNMVAQNMDAYSDFNLAAHIAVTSNLNAATVAKNATYLADYVLPPLADFRAETVSLSNALLANAVTDPVPYADLAAIQVTSDGFASAWTAMTFPPPTVAAWNALISLTSDWFSEHDPVPRQYLANDTAMTAATDEINVAYVFNSFSEYNSNVLLYREAAGAATTASAFPASPAAANVAFDALYAVHSGLAQAIVSGYPYGDPPSTSAFATNGARDAVQYTELLYTKYRTLATTTPSTRLYLTYGDLAAGRVSFSNTGAGGTAATIGAGAHVTFAVQFPQPTAPATTAPPVAGPFTVPIYQYSSATWTGYPYVNTKLSLTINASSQLVGADRYGPEAAAGGIPMAAASNAAGAIAGAGIPATGAVYIVQEPRRGTLVRAAGGAIGAQLSNVRYIPNDPWPTAAAETDRFTLIAAAPTGAIASAPTTTISVTAETPAAVPGSAAWIAAPPATPADPIPVPAPARQWEQVAFAGVVHDFTQFSYTPCNIDVTLYTYNGGAIATACNIAPLAAYYPADGFHVRTSNIAETSNLSSVVSPPPTGLGYGQINVTYNFLETVNVTSMDDVTTEVSVTALTFTPTFSNVLYPDETSNIAVSWTSTVNDVNRRAYDSIARYHAYDYSNIAYTTYGGHWLASNETFRAVPGGPALFSYETRAGDGPLLYDATCNYTFTSNIIQRDPYFQLNRHYLYKPAPDGDDSRIRYGPSVADGAVVLGVVASNTVGRPDGLVAPSATFTQADVSAGRIYVRLAGAGAAPAAGEAGSLSLSVTGLSDPGAPSGTAAAPAALSIRTLSTSNALPLDSRVVATPLAPTTLALDDNFRSSASLNALLLPAQNPAYASLAYAGVPAPTHVTFKPYDPDTPASAAFGSGGGLAAGYFLYAPTGERRLTYALSDLSNVRYATAGPDARIRTDRVAFYYSAAPGAAVAPSAAADSNVYVANLALARNPTSHGQDLNVGLTVAPGSNLLTPAAFHHSRAYAPPSTLGVKILNATADFAFSQTEFTMDELVADKISVTVNAAAIAPGTTYEVQYDLYANLTDVSATESDLTFPIKVYEAHQFPRLEDWAAPSNALRQAAYGDASAQIAGDGVRPVGPAWDALAAATIQGSPASCNLFMDLLTPTARGFLHATATAAPDAAAASGSGCNVLQSLSVTDLFGYGAAPAASNVRYVAYDPAQQANDTAFGVLRFGGPAGSAAASAPFALPLQNYLARFGGAATSPYAAGGAINVGLRDPGARAVALNSALPRSAGLVADGYVWRREEARAAPNAAGETWLPALNDPAPETRISLVSTAPNAYGPAYTALPGASNLLYAPAPYRRSERVAFSGGILTTTLDQCDRVSLRDDIGAGGAGAIAATVTSNVSEIQSLTYYVTVAPQQGILYSTGGPSGPAGSVASFTDADLAANRIYYQHSGGADTFALSDEIRLAVATTPYDLSGSELTLRFVVRPLPRVILDTEAFVYASNVSSAFANRYTVSDHLTVAPPAAVPVSEATAADYGYIHPVSADKLAFVPDGVFSAAPAPFAAARYRYTELAGCNVPTAGSIGFIVNNRSNAEENAIAQDAFYGPMFSRTFTSHLNEFRHSNAVLYPPPIQDSNQTLEYTINPDSVGASNFAGRIVTVGLQVQPSQGLSAPPYTDWLNTYEFSVILRSGAGGGAAPLLSLDFTHSNIAVARDGATVANVALPAASDFRFAFGQWGNMTIYNRDPDNDNAVSLYINADLFTTKEARVERNVLQGLSVSGFEFADVTDIDVATALTGASNYYASVDRSLVAAPYDGAPGAPPPADALGQTFRLSNYATSLYFRNLEIAATTYDYTATGASGSGSGTDSANGATTVHNVIIGRDVIVRGVNNICVGNRFSTSGANSIILGNDIGILVQTSDVGVGQINDIYESIIIGNNSYQNSIVRNIISIGREIFNDLYLAPLTNVNAFLSQKPIVIGNSITTASLDYHINVGNTFLKTTIGGPQIYLGTEREVVAIGYTSNAHFTPTTTIGGSGISGQSGAAVTRPLIGSSSNALYVNGGAYVSRELHAGHALIAPARRMEAALDVDGPGGIAAAAYAGLSVSPGDLLLATGAIYTNPSDPDVAYPYAVFSHHSAVPSSVFTAACVLGVLAAPTPTPHPSAWAPTSAVPIYGLQIVTAGIAPVHVFTPGAAVNLGDYIQWEPVPPGTFAHATVQAPPRNRATAIARALETVAAPISPATTVLVRCQLWF